MRLVVFFTVFLDMVGYGIVIPLLPFYVKSMHGSAEVVGFILTCFALTQFVATPVLGRLSDRFGRRRVILLSLAGNAVAMLIFAVATHFNALTLLFLSRIFAGATSGNLSACQAAIADVAKGAERAKAMGLVGAGIGVGMIIGPVVGGALGDVRPWAPPLAAGAFALCDLALVYALMPETNRVRGAPPSSRGRTARAHLRRILEAPALITVLALTFLTFLCITNMQVALALLAHDRFGWGQRDVGRLFGLNGLIALVVQAALIGPLARTFGQTRLVVGGSAFVGAGLLLIGAARSPTALIAGLVVLSVGFAVVNPLLATLASDFAPEGRQGMVLGVAQSSGGAARTLGPTLSGELYAHVGPSAPFFGGALAALVSTLLALRLALKNANRAMAER